MKTDSLIRLSNQFSSDREKSIHGQSSAQSLKRRKTKEICAEDWQQIMQSTSKTTRLDGKSFFVYIFLPSYMKLIDFIKHHGGTLSSKKQDAIFIHPSPHRGVSDAYHPDYVYALVCSFSFFCSCKNVNYITLQVFTSY
jgi:hypothetical protein